MTTTAVGILLAASSAIFNGSFASLFKTKHMVELSIHPMIFQLYVATGVFVTSLLIAGFLLPVDSLLDDNSGSETGLGLVILKVEVLWASSWMVMGLIAGGLFVLAIASSFQAVELIGVALAQGVWGGVAMMIGYLWGVIVFREIPTYFGLSMIALILLIIGVLCIAFCEALGRKMSCGNSKGVEVGEESNLELGTDDPSFERSPSPSDSSKLPRGVAWACSTGIFGGSILAPLHYVPIEQQGVAFMPSFGMGAMLSSPLVLYLYHILLNNSSFPKYHARKALPTGMLSGLVYNIGNLLSILAIPVIGYGVATPILQCAILVSGALGIYLFKEITNIKAIVVFWVGGFVLLSGGTLLTLSG